MIIESLSNVSAWSRSIILLYVIISGNFLASTFSCRMQQLLENSKSLKHIFGLITMYLFVNLSQDSNINATEQFKNTILYYLMFIFTTKSDPKYLLLIILFLIIIFINSMKSETNIKQISKLQYEELIAINPETKKQKQEDRIKLLSDNKKKAEINNYLGIFATCIAIIGFLIYMAKKRIEYADNWSYTTFFFGVNKCKNINEKVTDFFGSTICEDFKILKTLYPGSKDEINTEL
jgi:hypothetical protein